MSRYLTYIDGISDGKHGDGAESAIIIKTHDQDHLSVIKDSPVITSKFEQRGSFPVLKNFGDVLVRSAGLQWWASREIIKLTSYDGIIGVKLESAQDAPGLQQTDFRIILCRIGNVIKRRRALRHVATHILSE